MSKRSRVWQYFEKISNSDFAKCVLCNHEYKTSGNTTNLTDHMKRKHKPEWAIVSGESDESSMPGCSSSPSKSRRTIKQYFDRTKYYVDTSTRKKKLDDLYVRMIVLDMDPLRKGEHEGFRNFVAGLDDKYQIPDTATLKSSLLPKYYEEIKIQLQSALDSTQFISLTTDMWTNTNNEGILAITAHFFYKNKLIAPLLTTVKVEGRHTSEAMAEVS